VKKYEDPSFSHLMLTKKELGNPLSKPT